MHTHLSIPLTHLISFKASNNTSPLSLSLTDTEKWMLMGEGVALEQEGMKGKTRGEDHGQLKRMSS